MVFSLIVRLCWPLHCHSINRLAANLLCPDRVLGFMDTNLLVAGEQPPLGLILCADKSEEQIELLQMDQSGIHVAAYLTELPPLLLCPKNW